MEEGKKIVFQKSVIKKPGKKLIKPQSVISNIFQEEYEQDAVEMDIGAMQVRSFGSSLTLKKSVKELNKAIQEDESVFEYDNVYDSMIEKKNSSQSMGSRMGIKEQPKYMEAILEAAAFRKRENDRRMERKIQKERETEGTTTATNEAFVTEAYRKTLEERREEDEMLKQKEEFDKLNAADKQTNMSQFYRHLILNQKMVCDDELKPEANPQIFHKTNKNIKIRDRNVTDETVEEDSLTLENESSVTIETHTINENIENHSKSEPIDSPNKQQTNVEPEVKANEEIIPIKKSIGFKIYEQRNTEETINDAIMRYQERKASGLLRHFLIAGIDEDD